MTWVNKSMSEWLNEWVSEWEWDEMEWNGMKEMNELDKMKKTNEMKEVNEMNEKNDMNEMNEMDELYEINLIKKKNDWNEVNGRNEWNVVEWNGIEWTKMQWNEPRNGWINEWVNDWSPDWLNDWMGWATHSQSQVFSKPVFSLSHLFTELPLLWSASSFTYTSSRGHSCYTAFGKLQLQMHIHRTPKLLVFACNFQKTGHFWKVTRISATFQKICTCH